MKHSTFISHTKADAPIANAIHAFIKREFRGEIDTWLAGNDLKSGDKWKNEIKSNIERCDAIISLITPNSKNKPWIFIEWSAFWLEDKDIYLVLTDDVEHSDLINPMQDFQCTTLTDIDSVKGLIYKLSTAAGYNIPPYDKAEDLIVAIKAAYQQQKNEEYEKSYKKYADPAVPLPESDADKKEIAEHFITTHNYLVFKHIFQSIKTDSTKSSLIKTLIRKRDFELAINLSDKVQSAEVLRENMLLIIQSNYDDYNTLFPLIELLAKKSQPELRNLITGILDNGFGNHSLNNKIVSLFENMAELRKFAVNSLLVNNLHDTPIGLYIVDQLNKNNRTENKKYGLSMLENGKQRDNSFDRILRGIAAKNQKEAVKLINELKSYDIDLYIHYINEKIITDPTALALLE